MWQSDLLDELESAEVACRNSRTRPVLLEATSGRRHKTAARYRRGVKNARATNGVHRRCRKKSGL